MTHALIVTEKGLENVIEHDDDCPTEEHELGGLPVTAYTCLVGTLVREVGVNELLPDWREADEGRWEIEAWEDGFGEAGLRFLDDGE